MKKRAPATASPVAETQVGDAFNTELLKRLNARRRAVADEDDDDDDDEPDWGDENRAFTLQIPFMQTDTSKIAIILGVGLGALHMMGKQ